MKTSFDIDTIVFRMLNVPTVKNAISGGIYKGDDRPEDSQDEDICINTISSTQDFLPQIATSNVNIYVADVPKKVKGKSMMKWIRRANASSRFAPRFVAISTIPS